MARARNIKPGFWRNEALVELPFQTRLLFIGLWNIADREGRLENRPKKIKMEIFPGNDVDVSLEITRLSEAGLVMVYRAENVDCIEVINFKKHQNPHHREPSSELPPPDDSSKKEAQTVDNKGASESPVLASDEPQPSRAESLLLIPDPGSLIPDSVKNKGPSDDEPARPKDSPPKKFTEAEFDEFWEICRDNWHGRPGHKSEAKAEFKKLYRSEHDLERIQRLTLQECEARKAQHRQEGFAEAMKHVCRWIKVQGWEDVAENPTNVTQFRRPEQDNRPSGRKLFPGINHDARPTGTGGES